MKSRFLAIFWGLVLIGAGAAAFLQQAGIIDFDLIPTRIMALIFGVLSAFFFLTYFMQGAGQWGWLFPACILGGVAVTMGLEGTALGAFLTGAPVMLGVAVPFLAVFLQNRQENWWALIPAWVMLALSAVILFEDRMGDGVIGAFVLYSIALPFLAVFLTDRTRRWALIPFGILSVLGLIPLLETALNEEVIGAAIMALFAIAFFVVYFWSKTSWWALIPAGVFASIAVVVVLSQSPIAAFHNTSGFNPADTAVLLAGIGLTFGALWLQRETRPTVWAKVPALILFALAGITLLADKHIKAIWPVLLIAAGAAILLVQIFGKSDPGKGQTKE